MASAGGDSAVWHDQMSPPGTMVSCTDEVADCGHLGVAAPLWIIVLSGEGGVAPVVSSANADGIPLVSAFEDAVVAARFRVRGFERATAGAALPRFFGWNLYSNLQEIVQYHRLGGYESWPTWILCLMLELSKFGLALVLPLNFWWLCSPRLCNVLGQFGLWGSLALRVLGISQFVGAIENPGIRRSEDLLARSLSVTRALK